MAIAITNIGIGSNLAGSTATRAIPAGGVPAGALLICCIADASPSLLGGGSISDTINTYTAVTAVANNGSILNGFGQLFYAENVTALTSANTITYTKAVTGNRATIDALYATGIVSSGSLDTAVTATTTGSSTTPSVTSGTPALAGELFLAFATVNVASAYTQDTGHSWATPPTASNAQISIGGGTQVNAGSSPITFAPTWGTTGAWAAFVYGFKAPQSYSVSITETGSAADTVSSAVVFPSSAVETGTLADTLSAAAVFASSTTEAGALADNLSAAAIFASTTNEAGAFADVPSAAAVFASTTNEAGTFTDSPSSLAVFQATTAELGALADSASGAGVFTAALSETGAAVDLPAATGTLGGIVSEGGFLLDVTSTASPSYTDWFGLLGGRYGISVLAGAFNGGLVELDIQTPDGGSVSTGASFTANGYTIEDLPPGQYRFMIFAATDMFASIARIIGPTI